MSQINTPQTPQRVPNEPYYNKPDIQASQRRRWGRLLLIVGLVWLALTVVSNGPWFAGFPFAPGRTIGQDVAGSSLTITTQGDDVTFERSADRQFHIQATVRGWGWGGAPDDMLRQAGVEIRSEDGTVRVLAPHRGFQFGNFGVELHVAVPQGAPVTIETVSGEVTANALDGSLAITTASGDVRLGETAGFLTVSTTSGDVQLRDGRVSGASVTTTSGDVNLRGVAGQIIVHTQSGDIAVRAATDATLELQSASGDVSFEGLLATSAASQVKSISGDIDLRVGNQNSPSLIRPSAAMSTSKSISKPTLPPRSSSLLPAVIFRSSRSISSCAFVLLAQIGGLCALTARLLRAILQSVV